MEHVWNAGNGELANTQLKDLETVKTTFRTCIESRKFNDQI
jgi:hypothetical protein